MLPHKRPKHFTNKDYHVTEGGSSSDHALVMPLQPATDIVSPRVIPPLPATSLTRKMIQQMQQTIHSAFTALGLSRKPSNTNV